MKIIDNLLHRNDNRMENEIRNAAVLSTVAGEAQKPDSEIQWREQLGTNYELLHDDAIEQMLEEEMYEKALVHDATTGKWQVVRTGKINYNIAALRTIVSHIIRSSFISRDEAIDIELDVEAIIKRIILQCSPDAYNMGLSNWLESIRIWVHIALHDSIDGCKAKLTKTVPRVTQVEVHSGQKPKDGFL